MTSAKKIGHRWSGWPGAWCLDCGIGDPIEECLAECNAENGGEPIICPKHQMTACEYPGSHMFDPYFDKTGTEG